MKQLGEAFGLTERSIVAHPSYPPSQDNDAGAANVDTEEVCYKTYVVQSS
jgi:hypothetical protein